MHTFAIENHMLPWPHTNATDCTKDFKYYIQCLFFPFPPPPPKATARNKNIRKTMNFSKCVQRTWLKYSQIINNPGRVCVVCVAFFCGEGRVLYVASFGDFPAGFFYVFLSFGNMFCIWHVFIYYNVYILCFVCANCNIPYLPETMQQTNGNAANVCLKQKCKYAIQCVYRVDRV